MVELTDPDRIFLICITEWITSHSKTTSKKKKQKSQAEMYRNGKTNDL